MSLARVEPDLGQPDDRERAVLGPHPAPVPAVGEKLADHLARLIEAEISGLGWPVGSVLGSEAELRARSGASRSVLREAPGHPHAPGPGGGLWSRSAVGTPGAPAEDAAAVSAVEAMHGRIFEAILVGDEELARHRMRSHLDAREAWYD